MLSPTQQIVNFVIETDYDDLPESVVHESKRVILDSIGCGIAGLATDKGKFAVKLATQLSDLDESSILGTGYKVACANAAFANAELISALDYDATSLGHLTPQLIPAPLALAEKARSTGKDLILATALGHEIAIRMQSCLPNIVEVINEGGDRGKELLSPVYGYGHAIIGATAGAGKILKLDREKMSYAIGIAGYIAPAACAGKYHDILPGVMTKYALTGWTCQGGVTATLLAEMGYRGDPTVLDGEHGFGRFYIPTEKWDPDKLIEKLGKEWHMHLLNYKFYPCCTHNHTALDCFASIIEQHNLMPEDIDHVTIYLTKTVDTPNRMTKDIKNQIDAQFSIFYPIAVLAHRVKFSDWQDLDTIQNPEILKFMQKISWEPYPNWGLVVLENPGSMPAAVEVVAKGERIREDRLYRKGTGIPIHTKPREYNSHLEEVKATDEDLVKKFKDNVSRALPWSKIDEAVECIFKLEQLENIDRLVKLVTL